MTKADEANKNRVFPNRPTKLSDAHALENNAFLSGTPTLLPFQIRTSKGKQFLASSIFQPHIKTSNRKLISPSDVKRGVFDRTTTSSFQIQPSSSGWPLLKDVITHKNHNFRRSLRAGPLLQKTKKSNTKQRNKMKRKRRISEKKGRNRSKKLIKQKLKVNPMIKNNPIILQNDTQTQERNISTNLINSSTIKKKQTSKLSVPNYSKTNASSLISPPLADGTLKRSSSYKTSHQQVSKLQATTSISEPLRTVTNPSQYQPHDEMVADQGNKLMSGFEPEVSMMDYAWNEDKIEIDFMTGRNNYFTVF